MKSKCWVGKCRISQERLADNDSKTYLTTPSIHRTGNWCCYMGDLGRRYVSCTAGSYRRPGKLDQGRAEALACGACQPTSC
ncbi:hypothetical protein GGTG_06252 [Gaeumannomyces tritici R3-111a-1]|uniref:Uncharacterized protein n=1 Tax=Gaeumannomyces tritici (strain R3-111a-1) TaxID=644352 RepID=J3NY99_GAET3|nr:hypothetical protein GGTG_06252 [Gaeumannomyces tritici R3-111a-1]EJT76332.1 hypothetical protein GGTG_06252 [Gaeumannomyces tritici R3-111a-1]